ncbi:MAG: hypothetical protein V3U96_01490 [Paracoccaceae bacterium]
MGRIAAINDRLHNTTHHERTTHFGLFDCIDDDAVAQALFQRVEQQCDTWQHDCIRGPFNLSVNEETGLQIGGFDVPNFVMNPGNAPYYSDLVQRQNYVKSFDLYCYGLDLPNMNPRVIATAPKIEKRLNITIRNLDKSRFDEEVTKLMDVYNSAWEDNWPWVPASRDEFAHLGHNLKQIADFDLVFVAEDHLGKTIGFTIAIPNIYQAFAHIPNGKLFPLGLPKLLWHSRRGNIKSVRVLAMGILQEWRGKGIDSIFHYHQQKVGIRKGYNFAELSQVLESNTMMNRAASLVGGSVRMTHRVFEKSARDWRQNLTEHPAET